MGWVGGGSNDETTQDGIPTTTRTVGGLYVYETNVYFNEQAIKREGG
jgi:hypothetical protein